MSARREPGIPRTRAKKMTTRGSCTPSADYSADPSSPNSLVRGSGGGAVVSIAVTDMAMFALRFSLRFAKFNETN